MEGTTWATVPARDHVKAPASNIVPTGKGAQHSAVSEGRQSSAADTTQLRSADTAAADTAAANSAVVAKDVTASAVSIATAASTKTSSRKNKSKKKKAAPVTKPPEIAAEKAQEPSDVAEPTIAGASRKAITSKKKKSSTNAVEATDANPTSHLITGKQASVAETSLLVANEASAAPVENKKKKHKPWSMRNKYIATEKMADQADQSTPKPPDVTGGSYQHILESGVNDSINKATPANSTEAAPADADHKSLEKPQPMQSEHISMGFSEAASAPGASVIGTPLLPGVPLIEHGSLEQSNLSTVAPKHSDSSKSFIPTGQHLELQGAQSVMAHLPMSQRGIEKYVASLGLPGISFDENGVCIAQDAPEWVRGRIARKVQCLVTDIEAGIAPAKFDKALIELELELEMKEKTHFDEATWNRLFKIEDRDKTSDIEQRELKLKLQEFDEKLAAGLVPTVPLKVVGGKVCKKGGLSNVVNNLSLPLSTQANMQQYRGDGNNSMPPPGLHLPSQSFLSLNQSGYGPQFFANPHITLTTMGGGDPYTGSFPPKPSIRMSYNHNPRQQQQRRVYSKQPCRNFARGYCYYGENCYFWHAHPHQLQTAAEATRRDSAHDLFQSSRSASRSSTGTGLTAPLDTRSNGWGHPSQAPSRMSANTNSSTELTAASHGSVQGSSGGHVPDNMPQKQKRLFKNQKKSKAFRQ